MGVQDVPGAVFSSSQNFLKCQATIGAQPSLAGVRNKMKSRACCWILLFHCFFAAHLRAQTLQVVNLEGHSTTFTAEQIAKLPHVTVETQDHDKPVQFEGVMVSSILTSAGIQLGDAIRGPRLAEGVLVVAADGYKVLYALPELDPAFVVREIILADKRDGKSLDAKEGPFRIVAPGNKRPARWARQVVEMRVVSVR